MKTFTETQKFRQWWFRLIITGIAILQVYGLYQQLFLGKPFGNNPISNEGLIMFSLIPLLIVVLFLLLRLDTKVDGEGVHYRFFPFQLNYKLKKWDEIKKAHVRQYKPILEYGGWGIRGWGKNKARNVSGNMGLQLEMNNGDKLLIGTQKEKEMEKAVEDFFPAKS